MKTWELKPEELKKICHGDILNFESTAELSSLAEIVGQERAAKALEFGLKVRKSGYNIFISGFTGTGRKSYAESMIKEISFQEITPPDWCYLYNFDKPDQPQSVSLASGLAVKFKDDMSNLVNQVMVNGLKAFASEEYGKAKALLLQRLQEKQNESLTNLHKTAEELGFFLKNTEKGLVSIPLNSERKPMDENEFQKLDTEVKKELDIKSKQLDFLILDVLKVLREMEKETQEHTEKLEEQLVLKAIEYLFEEMKEKYVEYSLIQQYLDEVKKDVLKNIKEFKNKEEKSNLEMLLFKDARSKDFTYKYEVNILVDNSKGKGAPIITEINPTYYNLIGRVEYENHMGVLTTDFSKIKAGSLHRANGGYLIIQCRDLLQNILSWNALKRALKTSCLQIENIAEQVGMIATSSLKPEPIPFDAKIVLIGSYYEYLLLYEYDEDFRKLFKIKAEFDIEMERNNENILKLAQFISEHCVKDGLRHFTKDAVTRVVEYSSRLADRQGKLSTRFNELVEIIYESDAWAQIDGHERVEKKHVIQAINEKTFRSNKQELKLREMIEEDAILIDVETKVVGQVNGLAVLDVGDYTFGKPTRITVNTYAGRKGIINIEREAKLSGRIHDKGVLILSGYLGEKFGHKGPLSFSATICFEQQYRGVDGDSASSAELYALLSSLSGVPLKQSLAVTGSINQKGIIQPIGGVNQKIEGFYHVCKGKGLNKEQGVIIPRLNTKNLMLDDEVIKAVKEGLFHIYAIDTIEEGMELLTDRSFDSIYDMVQKRLVSINQLLKREDKDKE